MISTAAAATADLACARRGSRARTRIGARRNLPGRSPGPPFIVKVRAKAQQAPVMSPQVAASRWERQVVVDRSVNGFINSLAMDVGGRAGPGSQRLLNVPGG